MENKYKQASKYIVCHKNTMENTKRDEEEKGVPVGSSFQFLV